MHAKLLDIYGVREVLWKTGVDQAENVSSSLLLGAWASGLATPLMATSEFAVCGSAVCVRAGPLQAGQALFAMPAPL